MKTVDLGYTPDNKKRLKPLIYIQNSQHLAEYVIAGRIFKVYVSCNMHKPTRCFVSIDSQSNHYEKDVPNLKEARNVIKNYFRTNNPNIHLNDIHVNF
jgi:hypothetical protein